MLDSRYSAPHWQLERKLADLCGEKRTIQREIQHRTLQIFNLNTEIERIKTELFKVGEPS